MFLLRLLVSIIGVSHSCLSDDPLHAYSSGDIIIGGLFPIHLEINRSTVPEKFSCSEYSIQMFLRSQVMIYAIQEINQRIPRVLPGFTLGYDMYDTCGDVSLAIRAALQLMKNQSDPQSCLLPSEIHSALPEPLTKVVIGERYSEVSIAVARIFTLSSVAQISYASTSELLSKKFKFPTFLRTVSSDEFQTEGISRLVCEFDWTIVAIVGSDDEYGKYGSDRLEDTLNKMNVCVEFVEILSGDFSLNNSHTRLKLKELVGNLNKSSAEAIIMFTKDANIEIIMEAAIKEKLNRTWIASDTWSTSSRISKMPGIKLAGKVFGFIFKRNEVPGFENYVSTMFNRTTNAIIRHHLTLYPLCSNQSEERKAHDCSMQCLHPHCLASYIDEDESYSIYLAVQVVAEGLRSLLKCDNQRCERTTGFTTAELLKEIEKVNFTVDGTRIYFKDGDPSLGYDIVYWNMSKEVTQIQDIGEYWPNGTIKLDEGLSRSMKVEVTVFNCSKTCEPGKMLKIQGKKCCLDCVPCASGEFSPGNGTACERCGDEQYSLDELRDTCMKKNEDFLQWTDPVSIILSCLAVFAIIVTIGFAIIFIRYRTTPVVKAVGGYLCFLELLSLLCCFCLTFTFLGKPQKRSSCFGIPLFAIAFSLCISCILANLLQILVGFKFELRVDSWIKKINQPIAVVIIISGIQLALSVAWLIVKPPDLLMEPENSVVLHQCEIVENGTQMVFFIATIAYNAFLGLICFLFAYKSKQLPDLYKNGELIAVSMVLFLIIWIVFLPLYLTLKGKYRPAISSAAILICSFSILGCHLAPKCYIMLFRKELNNDRAITEYIRKHYEQKGIPVVQS
ncbi:G-protein coupled receptor family C group 6 member A-like [Odontesthes bonariensis]|uniref:G-protein coupled receptor family C group 6 member A-like n=1 Tax=Odontesthes bonariensis TaxID=219752 RepID=UPI003F58AECC